jgi:hypothetical protein
LRVLFLLLGLGMSCTFLLFVFGDFTPYVGGPDRDVWVTRPSPAWKLVRSITVAVPFAALSGLLFVLTGKLSSRFRLLRLFLITAVGLAAVVYVYGDFKTILGDGLVHYELPWGATRLSISAGCGAGLAAVATAVVGMCLSASSESAQTNAR